MMMEREDKFLSFDEITFLLHLNVLNSFCDKGMTFSDIEMKYILDYVNHNTLILMDLDIFMDFFANIIQ